MRCITPLEVWPNNKRQIVPCGKCLACLTNKRTDWTFRLSQEYKHSHSAAFVTLTYSEKFNPDGVSKRHLQLYMKRLRKKCSHKLRYYAVAEYGTKTNRPHYHLIIFNHDSEQVLRSSWTSRTGEPYGIVDIRPVNEARLRYCTKYVIQRGNAIDAKKPKPFMVCSRAYGIGLWYLTDDMLRWHRENRANYTMVHGIKGRLPRYYTNKIWYHEHERKRISDQSAYDGRKSYRRTLACFFKKFGEHAQTKLLEAQLRELERVKQKIQFTQTI